jgi:hypothetical protein
MVQRRRGPKKSKVVCPECKRSRYVSFYMARKPGYTGICKLCADRWRNKHSRLPKLTAVLVAPCGQTIVPCQTEEIPETMKRKDYGVYKGRCSLKAGYACKDYDKCLDLAAKNYWPGWRLVRGVCVEPPPSPPSG